MIIETGHLGMGLFIILSGKYAYSQMCYEWVTTLWVTLKYTHCIDRYHPLGTSLEDTRISCYYRWQCLPNGSGSPHQSHRSVPWRYGWNTHSLCGHCLATRGLPLQGHLSPDCIGRTLQSTTCERTSGLIDLFTPYAPFIYF